MLMPSAGYLYRLALQPHHCLQKLCLQWTGTRRDPILSQVVKYVQQGRPNYNSDEALKPYFSRKDELSVQDGCLLWGNRVVIPPKERARVVEELHDILAFVEWRFWREVTCGGLKWMHTWSRRCDSEVPARKTGSHHHRLLYTRGNGCINHGLPSPRLCRSVPWQNVSNCGRCSLKMGRGVSNEHVDFKCYHWEIENRFRNSWVTRNRSHRQWQQLCQQRVWRFPRTERNPSH